MLFRIGKSRTRLFDGAAILALKPGDFNDKFNFLIADGQCFESAYDLAGPNDIARFTVGTLEIVVMDRTAENGPAVKKSVLKC